LLPGKELRRFFKMSRSIVNRAISLRSRCNSAATAPSPLGAMHDSLENLPTHPRTQLGSTPRLLAAAATV